ncbi:hypothetical protein [Hoeflea sp. TYP-13]|uniref:hypothetical protein n=1 Tax=Hoeflea sp. TYP-13 TaxID=3230023 RepID=UPI0034C621D1
MFSTDYFFEEIPVCIGDVEVMMVTGTATLEGEDGAHDYGFCVVDIVLDGNLDGSYRDKRTVHLDPGAAIFQQLLFNQIAKRIEKSKDASEHFYAELEAFHGEAA